MKVAIRYYSGTGNTSRACQILQKEFKGAGHSVDTREIQSRMVEPYARIADCELLIVAFPTLGFAPPTLLSSYLKRLPKAKKMNGARKAMDGGDGGGQKAAVLCLGGAVYVKARYVPGWGAGAPFAASRLLARKAWSVQGLAEVSYPENWTQMFNPASDADATLIREKNDPLVQAFAQRLIKNEQFRLKRNLSTRLGMDLVAAMFKLFGRRLLARIFIADSSCTNCALCARSCPASAIVMKRGRPEWKLNCTACNRCINICPTKSIRSSSLLLLSHSLFAILSFALVLSVPLPRNLLPGVGVLIRIAALFLLYFIQLVPLSFLLKKMARLPRFQKMFHTSYMAQYRRYLAPGFKKSL